MQVSQRKESGLETTKRGTSPISYYIGTVAGRSWLRSKEGVKIKTRVMLINFLTMSYLLRLYEIHAVPIQAALYKT